MTVRIKLIARADGRSSPLDGEFVVSCDVDAHEGRGFIETTTDITRAKKFATTQDAWAYWARPSTTHPKRDDGKPNRPLTAFTVELSKDES